MLTSTPAAMVLPVARLLARTPRHVAALWMAIKLYSCLGSEIGHFGGLGGPGGPGDPCKRWGAKPPNLWKAFRAPRGCPDPQNGRFPILSKSQITSQSTATDSPDALPEPLGGVWKAAEHLPGPTGGDSRSARLLWERAFRPTLPSSQLCLGPTLELCRPLCKVQRNYEGVEFRLKTASKYLNVLLAVFGGL